MFENLDCLFKLNLFFAVLVAWLKHQKCLLVLFTLVGCQKETLSHHQLVFSCQYGVSCKLVRSFLILFLEVLGLVQDQAICLYLAALFELSVHNPYFQEVAIHSDYLAHLRLRVPDLHCVFDSVKVCPEGSQIRELHLLHVDYYSHHVQLYDTEVNASRGFLLQLIHFDDRVLYAVLEELLICLIIYDFDVRRHIKHKGY